MEKQNKARESTNKKIAELIESKTPTETEKPKPFVVARNNWSFGNGLVDTESDPDSNDESIINETICSDEHEAEESDNSLIDDEAEDADDYESGDSMDEDERLEIEENEIVDHGESVGSSTSDEDSDDDDDSLDSFIVNDDEDKPMNDSDSDESIAISKLVTPKKRNSRARIIDSDSSDTEIGTDSNIASAAQEIIAIPIESLESIVIVESNAQVLHEEKIEEGKTFATTIISNDDENQMAGEEKTENDKQNEDRKNIETDISNGNQATGDKNEVDVVSSSSQEENDDKQIPNENAISEEIESKNKDDNKMAGKPDTVVESCSTSNENDHSKESNRSVDIQDQVVETSMIGDEIDSDQSKKITSHQMNITRKARQSLPGIKPLFKFTASKNPSRKSMNDANENEHIMKASPLQRHITLPEETKKASMELNEIEKTEDKEKGNDAEPIKTVDETENKSAEETQFFNSTINTTVNSSINESQHSNNSKLSDTLHEENNNQKLPLEKQGNFFISLIQI